MGGWVGRLVSVLVNSLHEPLADKGCEADC